LGELGVAGPQGEEADAGPVELQQAGAGGDLGVEHQQLGEPAGGLLPVAGERQRLAGLAGLGAGGVGVDEVVVLTVLGEEGQHALGALRAAGHVMLLQSNVVAVVHDRVEVQVELGTAGLAGAGHGGSERAQQGLVVAAGKAVGVGAKRGRLRQ